MRKHSMVVIKCNSEDCKHQKDGYCLAKEIELEADMTEFFNNKLVCLTHYIKKGE